LGAEKLEDHEEVETYHGRAIAKNGKKKDVEIYLDDGRIVFAFANLSHDWCKYETAVIHNKAKDHLEFSHVNNRSYKVITEYSREFEKELTQEGFSIQSGRLNRGHKKNLRDILLITGIFVSIFLAIKIIPMFFYDEISEETLAEYQSLTDEAYGNKLIFNQQDERIQLIHQICQKHLSMEDLRQYRFGMLKSNTENAFAMPVNRIVFTSKLMEQAEKKPLLIASIIAHEIGHHQHHHLHQKIMELEVSNKVFMVFSDSIRAPMDIATLSFNRDNEREADFEALKIMKRNNIDPSDIIEFHRKNEEGSIDALKWLSTHPSSDERAELYQNYLDRYQ
jgi:Zn-dependent protease with chaperone function